MTWWGWTLLAGYLAGMLVAWPKIAYVVAIDSSSVEGIDVFMGYFFGALIVWAWPLAWASYALYQRTKHLDGSRLLVPPRQIRQREKRRRLEQRIDELERELALPREHS